MAAGVCETVWEQDGRFLEYGDDGETYDIVEDDRAIDKAYGFLRKLKSREGHLYDRGGSPSPARNRRPPVDETDESSSEEEDDEEEVEEQKPAEHLRSGTRVAVYDAEDDQYYEAVVRGHSMNLHKLVYTKNNSAEWVDLAEQSYVVVS